MIQEKPPPVPNSGISEYHVTNGVKNGTKMTDMVENDLNDLKMTLKRQKIVWDGGKSENEIIAVHSKSKPTTPRMPEVEIKRILTTPSRGKLIPYLTSSGLRMTLNDLE